MPNAFRALVVVTGLFSLNATVSAQVHYNKDGRPWKVKTRRGPDADAGGWYYNLGVTGIRAILSEEQPTRLLVKYVFPESPAAGRVEAGDFIVAANGKDFATPHRNGYNVRVFGGHGPMRDFGRALDASQGAKLGGTLNLGILRDGKRSVVKLDVGTTYGSFGETFPADCAKSKRIRKELCDYVASKQRSNGSWGSPHTDTFAALALLSSGDDKYTSVLDKAARFHAKTTRAKDDSWLINWRYMAAGIVLSEYYFRFGHQWVLPELQEIYTFLCSTQYTDPSQVAESAKKRKLPRRKGQAHGGWGHNPGFEGYGPIAMITAQGALTFSLLDRAGIDVDRKRLDIAYSFLARGTGRNGYLWYADESARHDRWADMGRTGASAIANYLNPQGDAALNRAAIAHARAIGDHPETLPDTHGSPLMGMGYTALGAHVDAASFRRMMDKNRWWFTLAQCTDGTFYYQPNRDNNPSDFTNGSSRLAASAAVALIFSLPQRKLQVTGAKKPVKKASEK
ncbi:MAG: DUF6288 domain-containing protein [Planctomycetota bacterium]